MATFHRRSLVNVLATQRFRDLIEVVIRTVRLSGIAPGKLRVVRRRCCPTMHKTYGVRTTSHWTD